MKRIFFLLLAVAAAASAIAQPFDHSILKLRLSDRAPIAVSIDGRYINRETQSLTLDGLRPGRHRLEVYRLSGSRLRPVRVYTGHIRFEAGTVNIGLVDVEERRLRLRTRPMSDEDDPAYADRPGYHRDFPERSGDNGNARRPEERARSGEGSADNEVYGHEDGDGAAGREGYGSFPHGRGNKQPASGNLLSSAQMTELRRQVEDEVADTQKDRILRSKLQTRDISAAQALEMMRWLAFESTRLDFAIWAFDRAADPENFGALEREFLSSESKTAFRKAIRRR